MKPTKIRDCSENKLIFLDLTCWKHIVFWNGCCRNKKSPLVEILREVKVMDIWEIIKNICIMYLSISGCIPTICICNSFWKVKMLFKESSSEITLVEIVVLLFPWITLCSIKIHTFLDCDFLSVYYSLWRQGEWFCSSQGSESNLLASDNPPWVTTHPGWM